MRTCITWFYSKKLHLISVMLLFSLLTSNLIASDIKDAHLSSLEISIINHEGMSPYAYTDTTGNITVGIGKNIDQKSQLGLSTREMVFLLREDIRECVLELTPYKWYASQTQARKDALVELCYNIGMPRLLKFKKMISALDNHNFKLASEELLNSKWKTQVGRRRSNALANQIKNGVYYI